MPNPNEALLKPKDEGFAKFLYNSEKGTCMGRTGTSWFKIGVFYVIFYAFLALFFAAMLSAFYQTLDTEYKPTYTPGPGGSILRNPAMGFRPRPREENVESTLIWYKKSDSKDTHHWTNQLDEFTQAYEDENRRSKNVKDCSFKDYNPNKGDDEMDMTVCRFSKSSLGSRCSSRNMWGYKDNAPCVLLKMNKMIDWEPDVYKTVDELPEGMSGSQKQRITSMADKSGNLPPFVWVSCEGEHPADQEYTPRISYFPFPGFPAYYFPYKKLPGYKPPLIGVVFDNPKNHVLINIECRLWAKNIEVVKGERLGMIHFELLID